MHEKHLLVFTGGTISAFQKDGEIVRGQKTFQLLHDCEVSDFDILEPVDILSENMTPQILFQIFKQITAKVKEQSYKSIIITHGTDTLAFTAQLGAILFSSFSFPMIFLGSKLPSDHPDSDGKINFHHARRLAELVCSGVYVISRRQDGRDVVFAAETVQQADIKSDDFSAFQNNIFGWFENGELVKSSSFRPYSQFKEQKFHRLFEREKIPDNHNVLMIPAYIGQDYSLFDLEKYAGKYILHQMYHSGTACMYGESSESLADFAKRCTLTGKQLFIAPIYRDRPPYETTAALLKEGVTPLYDMPIERAWAILTLTSWLDSLD